MEYEMDDDNEADNVTPPSVTVQDAAVQEEDSQQAPQHSDRETQPLLGRQPHRLPGVTCIFAASIAAAVVGSSTQFGFNSGVLNSPQQAIIDSFGQNVTGPRSAVFSSIEMTSAVAIFAIGGVLGALPAGLMADFIGRKNTLLLNNVVIWLGVGLESLAVNPIMFIVGRFVVGINSGINTVLVPLYISEIAPIKLRGAIGVLHQMAITTTILLSQVLGLEKALGRPDKEFYGWRILFAIPILFSLLQLAVLPWCPRSPRFLFLKWGDEVAAHRALVRLRGSTADITEEEREMKDELQVQQNQQKVRLSQFFTLPYLRRALFVSVILHLAQQLSGIGGIFYYSTVVFKLAGNSNPDVATVAVGVVLVVVTFITVFIIESVGRRSLMLYGLSGMAVFFLLLTSMFCFQDGYYGKTSSASVTAPGVLLVLFSLGIVALFALGPGGIPWLMVSELFLQEARPVAVAIATIVNWLANFTVGLSFPYILKYLYPYGTSVFVVTCGCLWLALYLYLPETKGRSVEQVTAEFKRKTGSTLQQSRT